MSIGHRPRAYIFFFYDDKETKIFIRWVVVTRSHSPRNAYSVHSCKIYTFDVWSVLEIVFTMEWFFVLFARACVWSAHATGKTKKKYDIFFFFLQIWNNKTAYDTPTLFTSCLLFNDIFVIVFLFCFGSMVTNNATISSNYTIASCLAPYAHRHRHHRCEFNGNDSDKANVICRRRWRWENNKYHVSKVFTRTTFTGLEAKNHHLKKIKTVYEKIKLIS